MASPRKVLHDRSHDDLEEVEPKKHKPIQVVSLEMSTLKELLREQADGIPETSQKQLDAMVDRMEGRQAEMFRTLRGRIDQVRSKVDSLEGKFEELQARLQKIEQQGVSCGSSTDATAGPRQSLIFGGWPEG